MNKGLGMKNWPVRRLDLLFIGLVIILCGLQFWFPQFPGPANDSHSTSADGKRALYELCGSFYRRVQRNSLPLRRWAAEQQEVQTGVRSPYNTVLCMIGAQRVPTEREWEALLPWVAAGGRVVFAVSSSEFWMREPGDNVNVPGLNPPVQIEPWGDLISEGPNDAIRRTGIHTSIAAGDQLAWYSTGQVSWEGGEVILDVEGVPQVVAYRYGAGELLVAASDWVFTNQSLDYGDNSVVALKLLDPQAERMRVVFDESLNRSGTPKVVGLLLDPEFRPATLQLLLITVLFCWWHSYRFGPWHVEVGREHASIVDHTNTVGALSFRAQGGAWALKAYLRQLRHELGLKGKETRRLLEPVAVRMNRSVGSLVKLLNRAARLMRQSQLDRRSAAEVISQLAQLRAAAVEVRSGSVRGGIQTGWNDENVVTDDEPVQDYDE